MPKLIIINFSQGTDTFVIRKLRSEENLAMLSLDGKKSTEFASFIFAFLSLNKSECPLSRTLSIEIKLNLYCGAYSTYSNCSLTFSFFFR